MTWDILIGCIVIVIARIGDVSLGSLRTVTVVSGHRGMAWLFGLFEVIIWVFVVSTVLAHIRTEPAYGIAYALGAATSLGKPSMVAAAHNNLALAENNAPAVLATISALNWARPAKPSP